MAEVTQVTVRPMRQRRGSILEALISDGQSSMSLTFFNQKWRERQLTVGRRGLFAGQLSRFNGKWQLAHPEFELLPDGVDDDPADRARLRRCPHPDLPGQQVGGLVAGAQGGRRACSTSWGTSPDPLPDELRADAWSHLASATPCGRSTDRRVATTCRPATARLRFEEAFVLQVLLAQRRAEAAALPAHRRIPERTPIRDAFDAAAAVRAHGGPARGRRADRRRHGARPPDAPAAAGRRRQRQDGRGPARHAPGGRRRRTGGAARAHRGARGPAPPVHHRDARPARRGRAVRRGRHGHPGGPRHRVAAGRAPGAGSCSTSSPATRASSSAPMPCSRTPSPSATSASSSSTSSTGSAWSSGRRWRRSRSTGPGRTCW